MFFPWLCSITQCLTSVSVWCHAPYISVPLSPTPVLLWCCVPCLHHAVSDICLSVMSCPIYICATQSNTCPTVMLCPMPVPLSAWHLFSLWYCVPYVQYLYHSVQHLSYCDAVSHACTKRSTYVSDTNIFLGTRRMTQCCCHNVSSFKSHLRTFLLIRKFY